MAKTNSSLEDQMRRLEWFHEQTVPDGMWFVVRVDGRSFTNYAKNQELTRPFDVAFHEHMLHTTRVLLEAFNGVFAYTESDEISVLFPADWAEFHRSVEKIVSLTAATASVAFTVASGTPVTFDSRIWLGADVDRVVDYFTWRAWDAHRCGLNTWAYWTLRQAEGLSGRAAARRLERATQSEKHELLVSHGVSYNDVPAWQRRGSLVVWESFEKHAVHGVTRAPVVAQRRRLAVRDDLPVGADFRTLVGELIGAPADIESYPGSDVRREALR